MDAKGYLNCDRRRAKRRRSGLRSTMVPAVRRGDASLWGGDHCHTFRAVGVSAYLKSCGRVEVAQRLAGHSNAKTIVCR